MEPNRDALIVLAADEVGLRITRFLVERGEKIACLALDDADRGGCNDAIRHAVGDTQVVDAGFLKDPVFVEGLRAFKPRLGVLAWWPHILKGPMIDVPELGWVNLHPGYLPYNRGKHPNFWCLYDQTPCGAALHLIDRGVDTGPVLARAEVEPCWEDTGGTIHRKCRDLSVKLFQDNFDAIKQGALKPMPQSASEGTAHRGPEIEAASRIDLDRPTTARELLNLIRARMFPPHPTATFTDGGKTYSVQVVIKEMSA